MCTKSDIRAAMWEIDPAGVASIQEDIPDEYDELVNGVHAQLIAAISVEDVMVWIVEYFNTVWGISIRAESHTKLEKRVSMWVGNTQ